MGKNVYYVTKETQGKKLKINEKFRNNKKK